MWLTCKRSGGTRRNVRYWRHAMESQKLLLTNALFEKHGYCEEGYHLDRIKDITLGLDIELAGLCSRHGLWRSWLDEREHRPAGGRNPHVCNRCIRGSMRDHTNLRRCSTARSPKALTTPELAIRQLPTASRLRTWIDDVKIKHGRKQRHHFQFGIRAPTGARVIANYWCT